MLVALAVGACRAQTGEPAPPAKTEALAPRTPGPAAPALLAPEVYDATPPSAEAHAPSPAPSAAPESPSSAPSSVSGKKRRYLVAAMGDSITDTRHGGGRYLAFLKEKCPESRFDSYGKGGDMVNQMRRRFDGDILDTTSDPTKPRYTDVIVYGGVNDLYSDLTAGRTVAKIEADLSAMYSAARAHGLRVIAVTVSPWGGFKRYFTDARFATTEELNRWILGKGHGGIDVVVDSFPILACGRSLCSELSAPFQDGLHFGPEGHRRLAEALMKSAFSDCR